MIPRSVWAAIWEYQTLYFGGPVLLVDCITCAPSHWTWDVCLWQYHQWPLICRLKKGLCWKRLRQFLWRSYDWFLLIPPVSLQGTAVERLHFSGTTVPQVLGERCFPDAPCSKALLLKLSPGYNSSWICESRVAQFPSVEMFTRWKMPYSLSVFHGFFLKEFWKMSS